MYRIFSVLLILGVIVWAFLLFQRVEPGQQVETIAGKIDDATVSDRCAEYRLTDGNDDSTWSLGYEGRIKQLVHGCF